MVSELYKHLSKEPERLVNQPTTGNERWSVEQIRIAASLLFIHIPEFLVATCKSQTSEQTKDVPEVDEREYGPLSYLMGSIISKMFRTSKFRKTKSILESTNREELQDLLQSRKRPDNEYILSLSRGGLWTPCEDLIGIGFEMEKTFRCETVAFDVTKPIPICELQTRILENPKSEEPLEQHCARMPLLGVSGLFESLPREHNLLVFKNSRILLFKRYD